MEFWGIEIKGDKPVKVQPDDDQVIHLSQATLGQLKKVGDPVTLSVKIGDQKLVLGILSPDNFPQLSFDLVFEKEFELSHNCKNGSVHLCGYKSIMQGDDGEEYSDFSDEDEHIQLAVNENGKAALLSKPKPEPAQKPKDGKPKGQNDEDDDSDESDDDDGSDEDDSDDEDMLKAGGDSDEEDDSDEDDDSEEGDEKPSKNAETGKKRPAAGGAKTPESKKAKVATPQKTDGKKGGHTATPHPAKKGGKTPNAAETPKSGNKITCGSCKKTFNSEKALESHSKAKHSAGK